MDSLINFMAVAIVFFVIFKTLGSLVDKSGTGEESDDEEEYLNAYGGLEEPIRRMLFENPPEGFFSEPDHDSRRRILDKHLKKCLNEESHRMKIQLSDEEKEIMIADLIDDMLGFGPIQKFIDDKNITEVRVEGHMVIKISDVRGRSETKAQFRSRKHLLEVIERIFAAHGKGLTPATPKIEGQLPDGAKVTAWFADNTPESEAFLLIEKSV